MTDSRSSSKALDFIKKQMNATKFDYDATVKQIGLVMLGKVNNLPNQDEKIFPEHINVSQYYDENYVGIISGTWFGLSNANQYVVEIYLLTDTYYLQDTCSLNSNGKWQSNKIIGQGVKEIRLVKVGQTKAANIFVEYPYARFKNFTVRLYSLTDTEYLIDEVPIFDVGSQNYVFYSNKELRGLPVIKILHRIWLNGEFAYEVVGVSGVRTNVKKGRLPSSYLIPVDDPSYDKDGSKALGLNGYMLNSRSWLYDIALTLLTFTASGDLKLADEIMSRLKFEQNKDGSFNFSYDNYIGPLFGGYVRTGSVGWLLWGMANYVLKSNNHQYDDMIKKTGEWLLSKLVTNWRDIRYGLLVGGYGQYDADYNYSGVEIEWCSTEHQVSSLQGLYGAYLVTQDNRYKNAIKTIHASLISKLFDKTNNRFYQGVSPTGIDKAWALDCVTWAGLSTFNNKNFGVFSSELVASANEFFVNGMQIVVSSDDEHYNMTYSSPHNISGYKPYSNRAGGYLGAPAIVWSEGTLGYIAFCLKQGRTLEANQLLEQITKMQDVTNGTGGVLYATGTYADLPWEFHVWECVASSAWLYLINNSLDSLFPTIPFLEDSQTNDFQLYDAAEKILSSMPVTVGIKGSAQWKNNKLAGYIGPFYARVEVSELVGVDISHHHKIPINGGKVDLNDLVESLDSISQQIQFDKLVDLYGTLNNIAQNMAGQSGGDSENHKNELYIGIAPAITESYGRYGTSIITKSTYEKRVEKDNHIEQVQTNLTVKINIYFIGDPLAHFQVAPDKYTQSQEVMARLWQTVTWTTKEVAQVLVAVTGSVQHEAKSLEMDDGIMNGESLEVTLAVSLVIIVFLIVVV